MNRLIWIASALIVVLSPLPASADATLFLGANTSPENRAVRGGAVGMGLLAVGFEFEYASTSAKLEVAAPSLRTGSGNLLLQTPFAIHGLQPYFTIGGGFYRERLGSRTDTGLATNTGGGLKISLAGPLRLRLDYRLFRLGDGALHSSAHRLYAGLNLKF